MKIIKLNRIKCKLCGDIIISIHVHDFKFCKCGSVAVDGGHDYLRRCGERKNYEDMSVVEDDGKGEPPFPQKPSKKK